MLLERDLSLGKLARKLALDMRPSKSDEWLPREYLGLNGFRLTEEPRRRRKVLFLGGLREWGDVRLSLCPRLQWLFHESDNVVMSLGSPIGRSAGGKKGTNIDVERFFEFCEGIIPEKLVFLLPEPAMGALLLGETLAAIEAVGARSAFYSEMLRLGQGLFMGMTGPGGQASCQVSGQKALLRFGLGEGAALPIAIRQSVIQSDRLGGFAGRDSRRESSVMLQVDFAQFEDWEIERVRWDPLRQAPRGGGRLIACQRI